MARRAKTQGIYQRGEYWLDWDRAPNGKLRSSKLTIFWYDPARRRIRSASTRTDDVDAAKKALDNHYLQNCEGEAICPTCGQRRQAGQTFLVAQAISNYLVAKEEIPSIGAVRPRLNHVVRYIASLPDAAVRCEQVDEPWVEAFRKWMARQPVVSTGGTVRVLPRSLSGIENSVLQLAAAINYAHKRGDTNRPAQFRPIALRELNRPPKHRSSIEELSRMFAYASNPDFSVKRGPLHRFLIISLATLARPDAAFDVHTGADRDQWQSHMRVLALNPRGRRQTKKYRATLPIALQVARWLDNCRDNYFVGVSTVRTAWRSMAAEIGLPKNGEAGPKLIRRSMAKLLRDRLPKADWTEVSMFLGHAKFDAISDIYAPFDPTYLNGARAEIEKIIDEIELRVPGAFHRSFTGDGQNTEQI